MKCDCQKLTADLKSAGCSEQTIKKFMDHLEHQEYQMAKMLLRSERKECMSKMHEAQKKVDALDYIIYCLCRKNEK
jgi:SOS response regulatory protein OraA/RecX